MAGQRLGSIPPPTDPARRVSASRADHDVMTQTGHRKPQRTKRRMPASQRDREARIAVVVVLATAIGLIVIALSGRSSETDAAASDDAGRGPPQTRADLERVCRCRVAGRGGSRPELCGAHTIRGSPTRSRRRRRHDERRAVERRAVEFMCTITVTRRSDEDPSESVNWSLPTSWPTAASSAAHLGSVRPGDLRRRDEGAGRPRPVRRRHRRSRVGAVARGVARRGVVRHPHAGSRGRRDGPHGRSAVVGGGPAKRRPPPNSGSGRRIVYDRAGQRVWAVDKDGNIIRSWLVSGSKYSNELPGTHRCTASPRSRRRGTAKPSCRRWSAGSRPTSAPSGSTRSRSRRRTTRRTRPRPSSAPACRAAASARPIATPSSCGTSPTSAPPSSSSTHATGRRGHGRRTVLPGRTVGFVAPISAGGRTVASG